MAPRSSPLKGQIEPERQCSLDIHGQTVCYGLYRSRRRTIGLSVDHRGLRVGAPLGAALRDIESLLREHGQWVLDKLAHWQAQRAAATLVDGSRFPWLGQPLQLLLPDGLTRSRWGAAELQLAVPAGKAIEPVLRRVLQQRARSLFLARLEIHAARLGVPTPPLFLSSARTRWGSCNSKGEIRLSWRLGHVSLALIDYVVIHELAHLKEMNHGPRFWAIVERLYPDWRWARAELQRQASSLPPL